MKFIERSLSEAVLRASRTFKCLLVSGPRQVGKTTLLKSLAGKDRRIVTLDDVRARALAKRDPELFLATYPPPVMIDEVQYAPELFPYIKMQVDSSERTGQYWLTGSQPFRLMKNVSESLAGRVAILTLQGLSEAERSGVRDTPFIPGSRIAASAGRIRTREAAAAAMFRGGFPQLTAIPETDVGLFMSSYVATYLERDVRDLVRASHELEFSTFLSCLAARTGQLLNATALAQDVGVSAPTIREWLSILESSGVVVLLHPYRSNLTRRAIATPKVYFTDTGLAAHLCGIASPEELARSEQFGHLFENWVIMDILKSWWHAARDCRAFFFRDREGHEIDLLVQNGARRHPIEIKAAALPQMESIRVNFRVLAETGVRLGPGAVVCLSAENMPLDKDLSVVNAGNIGFPQEEVQA